MYEQVGRYYALFGPTATTTAAEERFLRHWTQTRTRALDFGAGLCGPALVLRQLGLEVLAFEPSPVIAILALDRLSRNHRPEDSITLAEGPTSAFDEPYRADFIIMRSVLMLLNDSNRAAALDAVVRHALAGARLVVDVRTAHLPWADRAPLEDERRLGHTVYRRTVTYSRTTGSSPPRSGIRVPNAARKRGAHSSPISTIIWRNSVRQCVERRCIGHVSWKLRQSGG
jgi:hypothetical protein